jgi:hypothetical protein
MSIQEELRQQTQIAEALQTYSKEELVDMLAHLMKAYVIDGVAPVKVEVGKVHVPQHLRGLSFPDLMETLKFHLDLPELERISVTNGQVFVKLGEQEYAFDGTGPTTSRRATEPPPLSPPAARPSIDLDDAPSSPRQAPTPAPPAASKRPSGSSDRFRMLELD